ncbi:S-adenosyl-L-methionine-dependent methyltransferase [Podospora didyma]|uniref:S-adenosyl-L-methionine-dependent methyltransferase n=1 Tax=Podospora didyma TaxID=330526 RepID=A0AAE0P4Q3_9PEZI|nr:S-adenosyl-L-methionine-dependent methyltransferase [Podospora didyma]
MTWRAERSRGQLQMGSKEGELRLANDAVGIDAEVVGICLDLIIGHSLLHLGVRAGPALDIGGSRGYIAIALASRFDSLRVTLSGAPDRAGRRVLLRSVFHNWSDKYCVKILRAQIPALKKGSRILVQDTCMPEEQGEIPLWREKELRQVDPFMTMLFNASKRTADEWESLLNQAHLRFLLKQIIKTEGSALALLDISWEAEE